MAGAGSLYFDGITYELLHFHFHSPSEHTIAGQYYPLEAHLVHRASDGSLAYVSLLFKYGRSNSFLQTILGTVSMLNICMLQHVSFLSQNTWYAYQLYIMQKDL